MTGSFWQLTSIWYPYCHLLASIQYQAAFTGLKLWMKAHISKLTPTSSQWMSNYAFGLIQCIWHCFQVSNFVFWAFRALQIWSSLFSCIDMSFQTFSKSRIGIASPSQICRSSRIAQNWGIPSCLTFELCKLALHIRHLLRWLGKNCKRVWSREQLTRLILIKFFYDWDSPQILEALVGCQWGNRSQKYDPRSSDTSRPIQRNNLSAKALKSQKRASKAQHGIWCHVLASAQCLRYEKFGDTCRDWWD